MPPNNIPPVSGILETSLYVEDIERSETFYRELFGFPSLLKDHRMCALQVPSYGVLLIFQKDGSLSPSEVPGGIIPPHGGHGALHLCFAIPKSELESWVQHLQRRNIEIESKVIQAYDGTSLYFRDPDGHSIEVATPGLWKHY